MIDIRITPDKNELGRRAAAFGAEAIRAAIARHGEASEARQYSGRVVEPDWSAPFRYRGADNDA